MAGSAGNDGGLISGINVTPLVDITLVLLLIAIVTSRVVDMPAVPLDLPKAVKTQQVQLVFAVTVPATGPLRVNGTPLATDEGLLQRARRERRNDPELRAVIQADGAVPHRRVLHVLDLLRQAGLTKVAFAAEPVSAATGSGSRAEATGAAAQRPEAAQRPGTGQGATGAQPSGAAQRSAAQRTGAAP